MRTGTSKIRWSQWSLILLLLVLTGPNAYGRRWSDKSGKFTIDADLVSVDKNAVVLLQRKDGSRVRISFHELSDDDQGYIRDLAKRLQKARPSGAPSVKPSAPSGKVSAPPASLGLGSFYRKYVDFKGVAIVSSGVTEDNALLLARESLRILLGKRPDVVRSLAAHRLKVVVIAQSETVLDVPENAQLTPADYWKTRTRSIAASLDRPFMTIPEENILGRPTDPYAGESLVVHELAHTVHNLAMRQLDPEFDQRLEQLYQSAKKRGLWIKTFAATNAKEYWAEGVQCWFSVNRLTSNKDGTPDGLHNHIDTREKLLEYDPQLAQLAASVFP